MLLSPITKQLGEILSISSCSYLPCSSLVEKASCFLDLWILLSFFPLSFELIPIKMSLHMPQVYQVISTLLQVKKFSFSISLSKSEITSCKLTLSITQQKPSAVVFTRNPRTRKVEAGRLKCQGYSKLHNDFELCVGYTWDPIPKIKNSVTQSGGGDLHF